MLQRIQTVYLTLVVVFVTLSVMLPLAFYSNLTTGIQFDYSILKFLSPSNKIVGFNSLPLLVPALIAVVLSASAVFLYKNRKIQLKLTVYGMIFNVVYLGLIVFYLVFILNNSVSGDVKVMYKYPLVFPVISLIFSYLAIRGIKKDDELVKSLDRLR